MIDFRVVLVLVIAFPTVALGRFSAPPPDREREIDAAVALAMKTWRVPGAAVVVVRDDRVIHCKGYGLRRVTHEEPVTSDTLFAISSCTKGFTSAALALLVDEGKLDWDDPVNRHLPWFALSDPLVSRQVRLRDLLCHRTGLARHDLLWYRAPWSPEEAARRLVHLPLDRPFRASLQYQSSAFAVAGLAGASAAGSSWSDLVRKRLLVPLGMTATCLDDAEAARSSDRASPHRLDRAGSPEVLPRLDASHAHPAISIHSSARDLGTWLRFQLSGGMAGDRRLVSAKQLAQTQAPQVPIDLSPLQVKVFPDTNQISYALGWAVHDHHGLTLISHGGAIDGVRAHLTLIPQKKLGIAVVANLEPTPMPLALASTLVDQLLGLPRRDWHALHRATEAASAARRQQQARDRLARRRHGTTPSRELAAYVGRYAHPAYGEVDLGLSRGRLSWRWRDETETLEHFHHDTFVLGSELAGEADVTFALDSGGNVEEMHVQSGVLDVVFRKAHAPKTNRRTSR